MKIGYLVHNLNDPAVERRCMMFEAGGAQVALAGFCRDARTGADAARRNPLVLGRSADAALLARAAATLREVVFNWALAGFMADCDMIVARNLEQLAMARRVVGQRPLVYECLDIHRLLVGAGPAAFAVRAVEGMLLPRVGLLITSSPAFLRHHFARRPLRAETLLVENKLLVEDALPPAPSPLEAGLPIRIGWFGMLRCRRTFEFLRDLLERANGTIEVLIAGKPSPAELPDLAADAARVPGMTFAGAYTYADLPRLYGQCHFAWTIDWFEEGLNSSWLLPNRLYEALAFGAVPIALRDIELGRWLERHDAGLLVSEPSGAAESLLAMTPEELTRMQRQVSAIDRAELFANRSDCVRLVERLRQVPRG